VIKAAGLRTRQLDCLRAAADPRGGGDAQAGEGQHAGAGPLWDLGSHSVDLARYLVGEIASVQALTTTFVKERPLPGAGTFKSGGGGAAARGRVTVEDAVIMAVTFHNGAVADLVKAVCGGPPIHPTIPYGVGTMQVLEAAKRSAATGATVRL